jgi:hypothetical protein
MNLGWRNSTVVEYFLQAIAETGATQGMGAKAEDFLIAVPVNGRPGNPCEARVNGVVRIDTRRPKPSERSVARMIEAGAKGIETDFGALLATRKNIFIWTTDPPHVESWAVADIAKHDAERQAMRLTDILGNRIEIFIASALSTGQRLMGFADWMFGHDVATRLVWMETMKERLERDGELAIALSSFLTAASSDA